MEGKGREPGIYPTRSRGKDATGDRGREDLVGREGGGAVLAGKGWLTGGHLATGLLGHAAELGGQGFPYGRGNGSCSGSVCGWGRLIWCCRRVMGLIVGIVIIIAYGESAILWHCVQGRRASALRTSKTVHRSAPGIGGWARWFR